MTTVIFVFKYGYCIIIFTPNTYESWQKAIIISTSIVQIISQEAFQIFHNLYKTPMNIEAVYDGPHFVLLCTEEETEA